jgi:CheY-like chemotaxis protein/anti-sigma regulatory factor (Ser/Thr protein kinase)
MDTLTAVLMLAKLESDRADIKLTPLTVADEVHHVAEMHRVRAAEKDLTLEVQVAPKAEEVQARLDPGALTSILQNLISNAIKFTEQGGITATVDVEKRTQAAGAVRVTVKDTGIGISEHFESQLFRAFKREEEEVDRSREGAGMGLALVKQLAGLMGGTVEVESEKGVGSRFSVSFPILQAPSDAVRSEATTRSEAPVARDRPTGQRVLVVEDNADTLFFLKTLLEKDYNIETVTAGDEALAMAREGLRTRPEAPYDLVLTDIHLGPGLSGTGVLRKLRQEPAYQDVPFLALTAYALPGDQGEFLQAGFDAYLAKPFTAEELLDALAQIL